MEVRNGIKFMKSVLLAEFLGTGGLMLSYNMSDGTAITALTLFLMIMLTRGISGGHINPAATLGVYIERKELGTNGIFAMAIVLAQVLGAICALSVGYMLRVTFIGHEGHETFSPGVNSWAPPILVSTDGKPAYGQVMLAETIGGFFYVIMVLFAKREIAENDRDPTVWVASMAVALYVCQDMFRDVSGGFCNPALALAQIIWQNFAKNMDPNHEWAVWTFEYGFCYCVGPIIGGFVAGSVFNFAI